ncbi:MAG TPA: holo-[acyl-carrier-protein] synthase [Deltaproteobacteria bacterium]|nr:holo-[acyl-carrier-protein] synthase [Deltaproteobacteria bacterium]
MRIRQGVDIVETARLRRLVEASPGIADSIFTASERRYCMAKKDPYPHLAGTFAAKEALLKALGRGLRTGIDAALLEIEVRRAPSGMPRLRLSGSVSRLAERLGAAEATVSISHCADYAVATVILAGS